MPAQPLPKVAVIGYPNVGKSTLVNRLSGTREAVTHARARRDPRPQGGRRRSGTASGSRWSTRAGSTSPTQRSSQAQVQEQARLALADADAALLVVDGDRRGAAGRRGARGHWRAPGCRRSSPSNKLDRGADAPQAAEFHRLGLGRARAGVGRARGRHRRPARPHRRQPSASTLRAGGAEDPDDTVRLAVIGRPNVGKSSLVNAFLGERARDRERTGRHHAGRDRHAPRGGRPHSGAGRHRRPAAPREGGGHRRLLRAAALGARGRARRRRAGRLRRDRGRDARRPADRGPRDAQAAARRCWCSTSGT